MACNTMEKGAWARVKCDFCGRTGGRRDPALKQELFFCSGRCRSKFYARFLNLVG